MIEILSVTFPFFALIAIGYLAARTRALPATAVPGLNTFVLYFALTGMLFKLGRVDFSAIRGYYRELIRAWLFFPAQPGKASFIYCFTVIRMDKFPEVHRT